MKKKSYSIRFSIMSYSSLFKVRATSRYDAIKKAKKKFDLEYKEDFRYPKFSVSEVQ